MPELATNVLPATTSTFCVANSNRDYNVIFRDESGKTSDAQLLAFEDTWHS